MTNGTIERKASAMRHISVIAAATATLALAGTVYAHPKLVSASPAANKTVAMPTHIDLRFSETLVPAFSNAEVTMPAQKGMAAMKVESTSTLKPDALTLVVTPKVPLTPGRYNVAWHVVSTDTHKVAGSYTFAVK